MNNNVCIILLIFLIVYLIYKISSNSCDCFSVGGNQKCSDYPIGTCFPPCEWNASTEKCEQRIIEKISLIPENPSQFLAKIKETYNASNSNGVFISLILTVNNIVDNPLVYLDGSGSIIRKDSYKNLFHGICCFGFIWDTDWLDKNLVDCFFPIDSFTTPIIGCFRNHTYPNEPKDLTNYCDLAHTSGSNIPDRCSQGLIHYKSNGIENLSSTNCIQKIKYDLHNIERIPLKKNKNCFSYTVDELKSNKQPVDYNEAVFLKNVDDDGIEISKGLDKLTNLEKPKPVALLFVYDDSIDCKTDIDKQYLYKQYLKGIKYNFTSDTIVIKAQYDKESIISFDDEFITLGEMPGYNKV
jgi:hypothetical protein